MTTRTKRTYDSKCYDLAEHFGTGDPAEQLAESEMHELACALQETVEDYFQDRRNRAKVVLPGRDS